MSPNKREDTNKKFFTDRVVDINDNGNNLKPKKSINSKVESMKFTREKKEMFEDEEKHDDYSINYKENIKDYESEISHYDKNVNYSESNNELNLDAFDPMSQHAYKEVFNFFLIF